MGRLVGSAGQDSAGEGPLQRATRKALAEKEARAEQRAARRTVGANDDASGRETMAIDGQAVGCAQGGANGDASTKSEDWAEQFLSAMMVGKSVKDATKSVGLHIATPYRRRAADPVFAAAWREASNIGTEYLEEEAARRAYHGLNKPVFYQGEQCGTVREYSDTLLMFLLKKRDPTYRDGSDRTSSPTALTVNVVTVEGRAAAVEVLADCAQPPTVEVTGRVVPAEPTAPTEVPSSPPSDGSATDARAG